MQAFDAYAAIARAKDKGKTAKCQSNFRQLALAATMFEVLADNGINIDMISTSAIRTSCVVAADQVELAVQSLHAAFEKDMRAATEVD